MSLYNPKINSKKMRGPPSTPTSPSSSLSPQPKILTFLSNLYLNSCHTAIQPNYSQKLHRKHIEKVLLDSGMDLDVLGEYVGCLGKQIVEDLVQVAADMRIVWGNRDRNRGKFERRCKMHFGGEHYQNLQQQSPNPSKTLQKILQIYQNSPNPTPPSTHPHVLQSIYPNCTYIMGLSKGNGVLLQNNILLSCAHVFINENNDRLIRIRCFVTSIGEYGIVRVGEGKGQGMFRDVDLCFGEVVKWGDGGLGANRGVKLGDADNIKFMEDFKPFPCIQVGLLFIPDQPLLQPFQTAQGFILTNSYRSPTDTTLSSQMGNLIHNCFGMWGTSGSPLFDAKGNLIGLHNAWNPQGYNIGMMVRDGDEDRVRVVRQYERRAISVHVVKAVYGTWRKERMGGVEVELGRIGVGEDRGDVRKTKPIRKIKNK